MAFQANLGLPMTGEVTSGLWQALLNAVTQSQHNPNGYTFALVEKAHPDTITIWHNGQVVVHGLADGCLPVWHGRHSAGDPAPPH